MVPTQNLYVGDNNNGDMTYYCTKKIFNLAGSSFKEILSNLRKFYFSFKEMCEIGSESPGHSYCYLPTFNKEVTYSYFHVSLNKNAFINHVFLYCKAIVAICGPLAIRAKQTNPRPKISPIFLRQNND